MKKLFIITLSLCVCVHLFGCVQGNLVSNEQQLHRDESAKTDLNLYRFNTGDGLKITVHGEKDLSDTYKVDGEGAISFPLIGTVKVAGMNIYEAEALLSRKLKDGYLKDPSLLIEVASYRPFSILGEVNGPGNYEYSEGLSVADAVALASGFTYRSNRDKFETLRRREDGWERVFISVSDPIYPGDVIYVRERLF